MAQMSYSTLPDYVPKNASLYFHRVGPDESLEKIAAMYNVSAAALLNEIGLAQPKAGDLVVIDLRAGKISLQ
jgi:hypothetical protein